jgi:hypothetical protein
MPCSQTPVGSLRRTIRAVPILGRSDVAFHVSDRVGSHKFRNFGAHSHGLHARCLRFAATVTRAPRKTRFRLVVHLGRAGLEPAGFHREVSALVRYVIASSSPRLLLAHQKSAGRGGHQQSADRSRSPARIGSRWTPTRGGAAPPSSRGTRAARPQRSRTCPRRGATRRCRDRRGRPKAPVPRQHGAHRLRRQPLPFAHGASTQPASARPSIDGTTS